jgi:hypothetical protein
MSSANGSKQIPPELQDSKSYSKLEKDIGGEGCRDFYQREDQALKDTIAECEVQIEEARADMKANEEYQKAAETIKLFNKGMNDATKLLKLKIKSGAEILNYRNQLKEKGTES